MNYVEMDSLSHGKVVIFKQHVVLLKELDENTTKIFLVDDFEVTVGLSLTETLRQIK